MNFLAHAYLADDSPALIVGGVAGDWVKGLLPGNLPADLARGVALHRAIDAHAETHPAFQRSRNRVSADRRRYGGVLVDIFYDHLLASSWDSHYPMPLADYCQAIYAQIAQRLEDLPETARPAMRLMATENWLGSYCALTGITDILRRMSQRARRPNPLLGGEAEFLADIEGFRTDFTDWLSDARLFAREWMASHPAVHSN